MIIKKLAVPFVNEKLLSQATHCSIASGALSEQGFDFVVNRLSLQCKTEILTALQVSTDPKILRRIWKHFTDRVQLKLYTKNVFHANVYILDLPFRKAVAFIGSGAVTSGGLKDNEELFYKITDPKEIENLKSWFIGYFEYAEPLTEKIIDEFEIVYPDIKKRQSESAEEIRDVIDMAAPGFNWESIKFKKQYFQKDDFLVFGNRKTDGDVTEFQNERAQVRDKLVRLHESIKDHLSELKIYEDFDAPDIVTTRDGVPITDGRIREMAIVYGRSKNELIGLPSHKGIDSMRLMIIIRQKTLGVWLLMGGQNEGRTDREYFASKINEPEYRDIFFTLLTGLPFDQQNKKRGHYWIQIAGEKRDVSAFRNEDSLWQFMKNDDWRYDSFIIGKDYSPGDPEIGHEVIASTVSSDLDRLIALYRHLKHP